MTGLQLLWFTLIGLLFSGFFFLEGFDFGVGMSVQTLAHNEEEKDQIVKTIGPSPRFHTGMLLCSAVFI